MSPRKRLGVQDALWLEMDRPTNLMVVDSLLWTATPIDWKRLEDVVRHRLWERYRVFRSVAVRDNSGAWYWVERPGDFGSHMTHITLPPPGGDAELRELIGSQRTVALDREQPLWRMFCVDGFKGGSALVIRTHHAIADGIRMVQLAMSVLDAAPDGGAIAAPAVHPHTAAAKKPGPPIVEQLRAGAASVVTAASNAATTSVGLARTAVTNPVGAVHSAATMTTDVVASTAAWVRAATRPRRPGRGPLVDLFSAAPGDLDLARKLLLGTRNDTTCWTGHAGTRKAVAWSAPLALSSVKKVARAHRVTVNDVLVTCVAGTLHDYLVAHKSSCSSVNWMIPVNLKPLDPALPDDLGNNFAIVQLELPTNIADPLKVLAVVKERMGRIKNGHEAAIAFGIQQVISGFGKVVYRAAVDLLANRAIGVLTNVPGPPSAVYLAGAKVEGMVGWAPLSGDQPMSFTIYSYDHKVFVGIACDVDLVPDHEQVVDGFAHAFRRLSLAVA